jgi:DNA-binding transcriptional regulator YiaG
VDFESWDRKEEREIWKAALLAAERELSTAVAALRPGRKAQYDRDELIALRESAELSKPAFARRLRLSEDTLHRAETTGLLTKRTAGAYVRYAKRKGKKIPTAISA